jgi:hypothetical protein
MPTARRRAAVQGGRPRMEIIMASTKQKAAARRNISKAASAAKRKRTISKLPKKTRTALGKQAAKVARQKRSRGR